MKKPIVHSSEIVHKNPWYQVRHDVLTWPNGKPGQYFVAEFTGAACVICIRDGKILTVTQYRHTIEMETIEIPMGALKLGQDPLETAKQELREETGYQAAEWQFIGKFNNIKGSCRHCMHVYTASGLTETNTDREDSEGDMTFEWRDLADWRRLIREGKIVDGETLAAWTLWLEQAESNS